MQVWKSWESRRQIDRKNPRGKFVETHQGKNGSDGGGEVDSMIWMEVMLRGKETGAGAVLMTA